MAQWQDARLLEGGSFGPRIESRWSRIRTSLVTLFNQVVLAI